MATNIYIGQRDINKPLLLELGCYYATLSPVCSNHIYVHFSYHIYTLKIIV
jgi:hypothetical protein